MSETDDTSWVSQLPEQLREAPYLAKAGTPEEALVALQNAAQIQGNALRIPGEDAGDEQRQKFYDTLLEKVPDVVRVTEEPDDEQLASILAKLGAPGEAEQYKMPEVEEWEWDDDYSLELKQYAQAAGMTQRQFNTFAAKLGSEARDSLLEADDMISEAKQELFQDWGEATDDNKALIRGWMDKFDAPEELTEAFEEGNMPPDTMKWLHSVAMTFKDGVKPLTREDKTEQHTVSPAQAQEGIQEILNNPAYFDAAHPLHKTLKERMLKYQTAIAKLDEAV